MEGQGFAVFTYIINCVCGNGMNYIITYNIYFIIRYVDYLQNCWTQEIASNTPNQCSGVQLG